MIHSAPRLGCAPGAGCCSACRLGDTVSSPANETTGLWFALAAVVTGLFIAAGAGGKLRFRR